MDDPSCPVCACFFKETGQQVAKILPCSHTFCKNCIERLMRRTGITCPECRKRHRAANGERTFPQNKYVLDLIKILKQKSVNENPGQASGSPGLCPDHDRELSLRCDSDKCRKIICQVCLLEEHSNHTDIVVDVLLETKKIKLDQILRDLNQRKNNLQRTREEVVECSTDSLQKLEITKNQIEEWIQITRDNRDQVNRDIGEKINKLEENITRLSRIRDSKRGSKSLVRTVENSEKLFQEQMRRYTEYKFDDSRFDMYCGMNETCNDVWRSNLTDLFPTNGKYHEYVYFTQELN